MSIQQDYGAVGWDLNEDLTGKDGYTFLHDPCFRCWSLVLPFSILREK